MPRCASTVSVLPTSPSVHFHSRHSTLAGTGVCGANTASRASRSRRLGGRPSATVRRCRSKPAAPPGGIGAGAGAAGAATPSAAPASWNASRLARLASRLARSSAKLLRTLSA